MAQKDTGMIKLSLAKEVWTVIVERTSIVRSGTDLDDVLLAASDELELLIGGLERLPFEERRSRRLEQLQQTNAAILHLTSSPESAVRKRQHLRGQR